MVEPKSPVALLVEQELKKEGVVRTLYAIATKLTLSRSEADAKDLLAQALARAVDPDDDPWRPGFHTFLSHMYVLMRQVRYRERRKASAGREVLDGGVAQVAQENTASADPWPDDELERMRSLKVLRALGERVLARLETGSLARQIYETAMTEDLDPSQEAERFRCSALEIKAAHERLRYHGKIVLKEFNAAEERRMSALQREANARNPKDPP